MKILEAQLWQAFQQFCSLFPNRPIITALFLGAIAFTGFCWNFYEYAQPAIYAATFTPKPPEVKSTLVSGKPTLNLDEILRSSDAALPGATNTFINLPKKPDDVFEIYKKVPGEAEDFNSYVKLDQFSGKVLYVQDSRRGGLGDRILNSFTPIHYGTFGGLPTRIFYVFVGLAPLVLFITGFVMWRYRYRAKPNNQMNARQPAEQRRS
ncbi:MAG: PepSY domain-containing protein [Gloeocapsa sp. UFS-A4-WI-NPMV-4B04]|nr:PepSY domain-containing protein [Gloeocapsa sp. UFS-A4-WI-NPMV-4B04]